MLTIIWCTIGILTSAAFLLKVTLFVVSSGFTALLPVMATFIMLYVLFLAEGLQVSALYIKEHSLEAVHQYIEEKSYTKIQEISYISEKFISCFDAFITGRQIIVITAVISFATLLNFIKIGDTAASRVFSPVLPLIESPYLAFMFSVLLPAWYSQLLPQFAANNRALSFIKLPWAYSLVKVTVLLDKAGAGIPSRKMLEIIQRLGGFTGKQSLVIESLNHHAHLVQFDHKDLTSRIITMNYSTRGMQFEETFELQLSSQTPDLLRFRLGYRGMSNITMDFVEVNGGNHTNVSIETLTDAKGRNIYVLLLQMEAVRIYGDMQVRLSYKLLDSAQGEETLDDMTVELSTAGNGVLKL